MGIHMLRLEEQNVLPNQPGNGDKRAHISGLWLDLTWTYRSGGNGLHEIRHNFHALRVPSISLKGEPSELEERRDHRKLSVRLSALRGDV